MKQTHEHSFLFAGEHAAILLVKMKPTESSIYADLILSMNKYDFIANKEEINKLEVGSLFAFNATFVSMGNQHSIHHLHADFIRKKEGFMEIPRHVHSVNQRYHIHTPVQQVPSGPS